MTLPAIPRRVVLSPAAKRALTNARTTDAGTYVHALDAFDNVTEELENHRLITAAGVDDSPAALIVWALTDNGLRMRSYIQRQFYVRKLAEQVRAEGITGEDLADVAAGIDAGEEAGTISGTSVDFQLAFELAGSLTDQSGQDVRAELEEYLGWRD